MATQRDYYDLLGVPRGAADDEVKRAFRKLAQQWHPDVNTSAEAHDRLQGDQRGLPGAVRSAAPAGLRHVRPRPACGAGEGFDPFGGFQGGFQGFGDLFDAVFGGATGGGRRPSVPTGADLRYDLQLTFAESIAGAEKEIEFTSLARCETCRGEGAAPGTSPLTCPRCQGSGEIRHVRSTMLGQMVNVSVCDRCRGTGTIVETPCHACRGDGARRAQAHAAGDHSGGHRRGPPGALVGRGRGSAARRRAGQPVRRRPRGVPSATAPPRHRAVLRAAAVASPRPLSARA